ncbi:hypothetical protein BGX28_006033 [Mortierella sp. GBA30]|nr:hypothetical protein BGX28_006033 [Mortierella sp. GBA30]
MNEKSAVAIPMEEGQPLLNDPARLGCTRGIFCARCVSGAHDNSKRRIYAHRTLVAMLLAWLYWSLADHHRPGFLSDGQNRYRCRDNLVPWEGPSSFDTNATNIEFVFGTGNLETSVGILTLDDIDRPMIDIVAYVAKSRDDDDKDNRAASFPAQKERSVVLDPHTKDVHHQGLYVKVDDDGNAFKILISADGDWGYNHRFCALVEGVIAIPKSFKKFGHLTVHGTVMDVQTHGLKDVTFEQLQFGTTVGRIDIQDQGVQVHKFSAVVTTGPVTVSSITAPIGAVLNARVTTITGPISVNALVPRIQEKDGKDEFPQHQIQVSTTTGPIDLNVHPAPKTDSSGNAKIYVTSLVNVKATSTASHIVTSVDLADEHVLKLDSTSLTGSVAVEVSDKFLGAINLQTLMGSTVVVEAEDSASEIEFEKNTKQQKIGRKHLKQEIDGDESHIALRSDFGPVELAFV